MMRTAARLHANQARIQFRKERQKLRSSQRLIEHDFFARGDPVDLENVLGQINADWSYAGI
jgi:hypothetical protein